MDAFIKRVTATYQKPMSRKNRKRNVGNNYLLKVIRHQGKAF